MCLSIGFRKLMERQKDGSCEPSFFMIWELLNSCKKSRLLSKNSLCAAWQIGILQCIYLKNAIRSVPITINERPMKAFFDSFSLNTMYENATVTRMLSLSIGTTTLTTPFWSA